MNPINHQNLFSKIFKVSLIPFFSFISFIMICLNSQQIFAQNITKRTQGKHQEIKNDYVMMAKDVSKINHIHFEEILFEELEKEKTVAKGKMTTLTTSVAVGAIPMIFSLILIPRLAQAVGYIMKRNESVDIRNYFLRYLKALYVIHEGDKDQFTPEIIKKSYDILKVNAQNCHNSYNVSESLVEDKELSSSFLKEYYFESYKHFKNISKNLNKEQSKKFVRKLPQIYGFCINSEIFRSLKFQEKRKMTYQNYCGY